MISTRSAGFVIDTVVCLTLAKWETVHELASKIRETICERRSQIIFSRTGEQFAEDFPRR